MAEDFRNPDHRQILGIDDDLATGSPHALAARAKKVYGGRSAPLLRSRVLLRSGLGPALGALFSSPRPQRLD